MLIDELEKFYNDNSEGIDEIQVPFSIDEELNNVRTPPNNSFNLEVSKKKRSQSQAHFHLSP